MVWDTSGVEELAPIFVLVLLAVTAVAAVGVGAARFLAGGPRAVGHSPEALTAGDGWYRQALRMARLLERVRNDDMIRVTFPAELANEVDTALKRFWNDVDSDE